MQSDEEPWDDYEIRKWHEREDERALTDKGTAEQNHQLLRRYHFFRIAADELTQALRKHSQVAAVRLFGSVAREPFLEVPRFSPYRQRRIKLWHECGDIDLAVTLTKAEDLNALRRSCSRTLHKFHDKHGFGIPAHQSDVFLLETGTQKYLGRLCGYNACPKHKPACLVPDCGTIPFLQQHQDFEWRPACLADDRSLLLFDRATGTVQRAADLPLPDTSFEP